MSEHHRGLSPQSFSHWTLRRGALSEGEFEPRAVLSRIFGESVVYAAPAASNPNHLPLPEISALGREDNRELFYEGLMTLGARFESRNQAEFALRIYDSVGSAQPGSSVAGRALERANALRGIGSTGARSEVLLRGLARETLEPTTLVGLTAATTMFRLTRLAALSRLSSAARPGFVAGLIGPRATANLLAFGAEALAFPTATRATAALLGRDPMSSWGHDIASSVFVLGAMRFTGSLAGVLGKTPTLQRIGATSRVIPGALQQTALYTGLLMGHYAEEMIGLRPRRDGATTLLDSLAMLVQLNAAGRLNGHLLGDGFRAWEANLDAHAETLAQHSRPFRFPTFFSNGTPRFATSAGGGLALLGGDRMMSKMLEPERPTILQMASAQDKGGPTLPAAMIRKPSAPALQLVLGDGQPWAISLRRFIDLNPQAVVVFQIGEGDEMGQIILANSKMERLTGHTPEETAGNHLLNYLHTKDTRIVRELLGRVRANRPFALTDIQIIRKDRTTIFCDINGEIGDFEGRKLGFAFIQDVSARHDAQTQARQSESRREALIAALPDLIIRIGRDGMFQDIHFPNRKVLPFQPEIMLGHKIVDFPMNQALKDFGMNLIATALATGEVQSDVYAIPNVEGGITHNEVRMMKSGPDEVVAMVRDVTEITEANAARDRMLKIIGATGDFISMAYPDGRIFFNNRAAWSMLGYESETDLAGKTTADFHPEWALQRIINEGIPTAERVGTWMGESALRHTSGREIPVLQQIIAHRNGGNRISHYSTIIRDLTPIVEAHKNSIAQNRLDAMTTMAQGVAHNGNNLTGPLEYHITKLVSNLGVLRHYSSPEFGSVLNDVDRAIEVLAPVDAEAAEALRTARERLSDLPTHFSADRTKEINDSLEAVRKIASRVRKMFVQIRNQFSTAPQPTLGVSFDLHDVFRDREDLTPHLSTDVDLNLDLAPYSFPVQIDQDQLSEIVENLLVNANDAMRGRVVKRVDIETRAFDLTVPELARLVPPQFPGRIEPGRYFRLRFQDTGTGMPESVRRKIFEPYFTTKPRRNDSEGGLGLATVHKYVLDAGGFISVETEVNVGTTFNIYLPQAGRVEAAVNRDAGLTAQIHNTKMLIVEDEPTLLSTIQEYFQVRGFRQILTAADGDSALRLWAEHPDIGFLLTDAEVPGPSVTKIVTTVRRRSPKLPMVVWTGGGNPEHFEPLISRYGRTASKPMSAADLANLVEHLIQQGIQGIPD